MRYIYSNAQGVDTMMVETSDDEITNVTNLREPKNGAPMTVERLKDEIRLYLSGPGSTLEDALGAYAGSYESIRRVEK